MEISDEKFKNVKIDAKKYYDSLDTILCPYLNKKVHFNAHGFEHILSKSWNRGRSRTEQYTRLRLLPKVLEILRLSHTLQEYDERKIFVRQKINSRWENRLKVVRYYVFIAFLIKTNARLKVVVKEVEGGVPFFWSIYPSWKEKATDSGATKKIFYSGNLEED